MSEMNLNGWNIQKDRLTASINGALLSVTLEDDRQYEFTMDHFDEMIQAGNLQDQVISHEFESWPGLMMTVKMTTGEDSLLTLRMGPPGGFSADTTLLEIARRTRPGAIALRVLEITRNALDQQE